MNLRAIVALAVCLSICTAPASSVSLLAAAAAVKGAIVGAGLTAMKSGGGSQTVIIQSQPGAVSEVVPANQVVVQDLYKPVTVQTAQTIYTSGNPFSRFFGAISDAISAKAKAIGNLFQPNHVVVVVPQPITEKTTTTTTTPKPTPIITVDLDKPGPSIDIDLGHNKPGLLPGIDIEVNGKPIQLPTIDVEVNHKPMQLPSIGFAASVSRSGMYRSMKPVAYINYVKK